MKNFLVGLSLDGYPAAIVSVAAVVLGCVALLALWLRASRRRGAPVARSAIAIAAVVTVSAVATASARYGVEQVWRPFPETLPVPVWLWIGVGVAGLALAVGATASALRQASGSRRGGGRALGVPAALVAAVLVVAGAAQQVNMAFSAYPNVGVLLGIEPFNRVDADRALQPANRTVAADPGHTIADALGADWQTADGTRPTKGTVFTATIPGRVSGFTPRQAQIYVPPAYYAEPRPQLPVIVALAGEPGGPEDWVTSLEAPMILDQFAARNNGLAPILVVADPIAQRLGNTLCIDSSHGNAETYLATDVPTWVRDNLEAAADPQQYAIAGLSFGGTCALQISLYHPDTFPTFLAMSAQEEPTLGERQQTVQFFFGGDAAAFAKKNPLDIMAREKFPQLAGAFVVGAQDNEYRPAAEQLFQAAQAAGISADLAVLGGGHSYALWRAGFDKYLPWISTRTRLVDHAN